MLEKAYAEVDRVFGADLEARPTYQQVTQLAYIQQILKEALRLWPPAPAFSVSPLKDERIGGKYDLKKRTFVSILDACAASRSQGLGAEPRQVRSREFLARGRGQAPAQRLEAVRQRRARLHRARLCDARGRARARPDPAALQADRPQALSDGAQGDADDQARRLQDQGAGRAARPIARKPPRSPRRSRRHRALLRRRARASATTRRCAIYYGSNLGTAEELANRVADLASASGFAVKLAPLDDAVDQLPTRRRRADLLRLLQRRAARQCRGISSNGSSGDLAPDAFAGVRYAVFGCGNKDWAATYQAVPRLIDERLTAHGARRVYVRGEGDAREDLRGAVRGLVREAAPDRGEGARRRDRRLRQRGERRAALSRSSPSRRARRRRRPRRAARSS